VLDRSIAVLEVLRAGPLTLAELAAATTLPRATVHRLATALEHHGLVDRDEFGRFRIGAYAITLAASAPDRGLADLAVPVLMSLRDETDESAQLFVRHGDHRTCIAAADRVSGLRDSVPVGAQLTMNAGSGAKVLAAWSNDVPRGARYSAAELAAVRKRGWAESLSEREVGVASVSAPVFDADDVLIAAMSVSGPVERLTPSARKRLGPVVVAAAQELAALL
jgi:DNA-binding IclR family transcriptional regulator